MFLCFQLWCMFYKNNYIFYKNTKYSYRTWKNCHNSIIIIIIYPDALDFRIICIRAWQTSIISRFTSVNFVSKTPFSIYKKHNFQLNTNSTWHDIVFTFFGKSSSEPFVFYTTFDHMRFNTHVTLANTEYYSSLGFFFGKLFLYRIKHHTRFLQYTIRYCEGSTRELFLTAPVIIVLLSAYKHSNACFF